MFDDVRRIVINDEKHSAFEDRKFCIGRLGSEVVTVRFTMRNGKIRILGAGFWRKGKALYEKKCGLY